ncbi:MAG: pyrroline-5-carboxylate reductase [Bdellovibrionota bacterium]
MNSTIGILGVGKMGEALAAGLIAAKKGYKIIGTTRSQATAAEIKKRLGIECTTDNRDLVKKAKVLILCVKPNDARPVLESLAPQLTKDHLIISTCASIQTEALSKWARQKTPVIRAMPNTPCLIREGMTILVAGASAKASHLEHAEKIFNTIGRTTVIDETLMDGATGLSGCGPAYVYLIIEALSEAGVKVGLSRDLATQLAAQTLMGAAKMVLERGVHPAALKDEVTTPAGCTIDGLMALEEGKIRVTLIKAVLAATKRSEKLRKNARK